MQTNQVQGLYRYRNTSGSHNNDNGNGCNYGPMRDKRNNRNTPRKPYNNVDAGHRSKSQQIAVMNQLQHSNVCHACNFQIVAI